MNIFYVSTNQPKMKNKTNREGLRTQVNAINRGKRDLE